MEQVQVPADVPVGVWRLQILSGLQESGDDRTKQRLFDCPTDIYILFNAWCEGKFNQPSRFTAR